MVQVKIKSSGNSILFSLCDLLTCVNEYPRDANADAALSNYTCYASCVVKRSAFLA
ncbi:hypothetical protein T12_10019 [Trichinella patagoniensis]|uniref:Uncharacterized protein n=1 Tax=Trichinella patagoniensis TaxID=990121 RepID=A0A0V0ZN33_9BILA|nr:hypothetical protein T12_10019 [Trichinella patagoniensis]